ncbi:MAG TPA: depupylase/deamidase Dop [Actinomycetota bacterium]|nr:depupylase/deamidase Dop [Actinomycetota bacterium]
MAIPKVMGIETEYGIIVRGSRDQSGGIEDHNPIHASTVLINSYTSPRLRTVRWDYDEESPLRDARGFERPGLDPAEDEGGLVSVILDNGARYYVDHAHPEYSTPECTNPRDLVVHDKAGERILLQSMRAARRVLGNHQSIVVYKNNSDGKGNSYGCHENYLVSRATPFPSIVRTLTAHLVTRQIYTGAGKVGAEGSGSRRQIAFQLSQRADFFEVEVGLETTFKRPIINTRDEPHADPEKYRRLHVIIGDANMSEVATYLKAGTTALVLKMIEDDFIAADLSLAEPVPALRAVSADPTLRATVAMSDGRSIRAVDLQWEFYDWARKYAAERGEDPVTAEILTRWEQILVALEADPRVADRQLDWVAKLGLIEAYQDRRALDWDDPKLALIDLQYHDVRPDKSLYYKLVEQGRMERLVTDEAIVQAVAEPPIDTRAWFRGQALRRFSPQIATASWDGIVFDVGRHALQKVPMLEPLRGTKAMTSGLFGSVETAAELLERLQG